MNGRLAGALILIGVMGCDSPEESVVVDTDPEVFVPIGEEGAMVGMTEAHNVARAKVDVPPLEWDDELAGVADDWAEHLASTNGCIMEHRPSKEVDYEENGQSFTGVGNYVNGQFIGENLYWEMSSATPTVETAPDNVVIAWESEVADYDYDSNTCAAGKMCGHYTQVVWKDTTHVGCSYRICDDLGSQVWVCNYHPAGNYVGEKPY